MTELLLTASPAELEARIRKAFDGRLNGDLRRAPDGVDALEDIAATNPSVVAIGPSISVDDALELAASIDERHPEIAVVLVTSPSPALWEHALRAGVREVLAPDAPIVDVRHSFERALDAAARRHAGRANGADPSDERRIIAIVSPKGGAGKTAIASNLAVGLAQLHPQNAVIVDLDLQFGDVANALRLVPEQNVADTLRGTDAIDATTAKAYLTPHPSGLLALCAPDTPADADDITPEHVATLLSLLAEEFRYVVVDTAAGLDEWTLAAAEHATDIVFVCGTDVASARSMRKELDAFDLLGLTTQRRHFVLNRADARVGLVGADIEATVGLPMGIAIPSSRAVPLSMNQGIPLVESSQRSPVSRALGELVNLIGAGAVAPVVNGNAGPNGRFRRWKETR